MNVLIGWILLLITMSVFITLVFGYDLDLKDKIICIVGTDTFCYLAHSWCVFDSWVEQEVQSWK